MWRQKADTHAPLPRLSLLRLPELLTTMLLNRLKLLLIMPLLPLSCQRDAITHVRVQKELAAPPMMTPENPEIPPPPQQNPANALGWTLPQGWTEQKAGGMRYATLTPPQDLGKVELSVVTLPGQAGGELANVNRWRGQLGLEPLDEAGLAATKKVQPTPAGQLAVFDFASTGEKKTRMVAGILLSPSGDAWFLKLNGDEAAVAAQLPTFQTFLTTLHFGPSPQKPEGP